MTGAARLCCEAAYRSGAGLVTLGTPAPLAEVMAAVLVEAMTLPLPSTEGDSISSIGVKQAIDAAEARTAALLGPGLSQHPDTVEFVEGFLGLCTAPCVVDADGLNCVANDLDMLGPGGPRVITPHPGEMARLTGKTAGEIQLNRDATAIAFASAHNCVVALKGANTVIAAPSGECYVNTTGNSGLATGGTGDVLAGIVGALLAQGMSPLHAAIVGVHIHGLAGEIAAKAYTRRAMIARDVIEKLPEAWRLLGEE